MRAVLLEGHNPSGGDLALMVLWVSVTLVSGAWIFIRYRPRFAEEA
jgi:ABC-type polysaccharide/polyol phosphate export permease